MSDAGTDLPTVSVIIPMLDAEDTLGEQLEALTRQTYKGRWEVILADNGSSDGTMAVARSFEGRLPNCRIIDASGHRGPGYARNVAARVAKHDVLAFCDCDDVAEPGWLAALVAAWAPDVVVGGRLDFQSLNSRNWPIVVDQDDLEVHLGFMGAVPGSNMAIGREAYEKLGGFSEDYRRCGDVDLSWRAQQAGQRLVYARDAVVIYRTRPTLGSLLRQVYKTGRFDARLYRDYRSAGVRRDSLLRVARTAAWLALHSPRLARDEQFRSRWLQWLAYRAGRLRGSVAERVLFP